MAFMFTVSTDLQTTSQAAGKHGGGGGGGSGSGGQITSICGNGKCESGETQASCPSDCVMCDPNVGSVTISTSNNPSPTLVRAGATGVTFGNIRIEAQYADIDLDDLDLYVSDGGIPGTANGNYQDSTKVYIYDRTILVASTSIPSTGHYQWTFPNGTTINGNDFLIIWADNDMPVLSKIREKFETDKPLKGTKMSACLMRFAFLLFDLATFSSVN